MTRRARAAAREDARIAASYAHCREVARTQARNFYYAFAILPADRRDALCAVYAFMRHSDDVSDEPGQATDRRAAMGAWRSTLDRALAGECGETGILPAFHHAVQRYGIPGSLFHELIDGVAMDLDIDRYETFDDLYRYCYRVASVVGLTCLYVWGFEGGEAATRRAEDCGIAFQITNILRDLAEDAERGRVYLPQEDLRRFGLTDEDIRAGVMDERFTAMMEFQVARARQYYIEAEPLTELIHPVSQPAFRVMYDIYRGLLDRIEDRGYDVYSERVSVPGHIKAGLMARAWVDTRLAQVGARRASRNAR